LGLKFSSESVFQILIASGLNATSLRIGQLTGGHPNGAWATTDWFPIMIKSSLEFGALPTAQGVSGI
jgi:thioester reductase-like protein